MFIGSESYLIYIIKKYLIMFNNKQELKEWIDMYIKNKGKRSLHVAIRNSKSIKEDIIRYTSFLPENSKFNQRCYHIINNIDQIPLCKECGMNQVKFNNRNRDWRYLDFCSSRCGRINESTIEKYKKTLIERYGVDNISKSNYYIEIMKKINNDKYGVDWYQQSDDFREKSIGTCLIKYGFDNYAKTDEFKIKIRETLLSRYGVDWYSKSKEFGEKYKRAILNKYGVTHPMLSEEHKQKVSKTIKERYGKDWYNLTNEFKDQCFEIKQSKYGTPVIGYKIKEYELPSGKIVKVQGYENFALDILLKDHNEEDLCISYYDIKEEIGTINYLMNESERIYLPDIYIKSYNKIIEVKSEYTYKLEEEKNQIKKQTCLDMGMSFEFWIIDKRGNLIDIL